jgi:hypothetical protein
MNRNQVLPRMIGESLPLLIRVNTGSDLNSAIPHFIMGAVTVFRKQGRTETLESCSVNVLSELAQLDHMRSLIHGE